MYKNTSDLAQRRARQLWLKDLQSAEFDGLTPEQQRESLKARLFAIEAELTGAIYKAFMAEASKRALATIESSSPLGQGVVAEEAEGLTPAEGVARAEVVPSVRPAEGAQ
jgi:hypothetical protein